MNRTVDEILKQYPYIGEDIQKAQKEINRYIELQQEARNPLKGQALTGMPHNTGISDQTYDAVNKIIDLYQTEINKYVAEVNELLDRKKWLDKAFTEITEDERRMIYQFYDEHMSVREMARKRKKGREQMKNMIDFAVDRVRRIVA